MRAERRIGREHILDLRSRSGREHEIVRRHRRGVARERRDASVFGIDTFDLPFRVGQNREERTRHGALCAEAALHEHRRAGRDIFAERRKAREVIGTDRVRLGEVLVEAHGVGEIGAERFQDLPHAFEDEIRLPA